MGEIPPPATGEPCALGCGRTLSHVAEPHEPPAAGSTPPSPAPADSPRAGAANGSRPGARQGVPAAEVEKCRTPSHVTKPHRPGAGRRKRLSPARQGAGCASPAPQCTPALFLGTPTRGPLWWPWHSHAGHTHRRLAAWGWQGGGEHSPAPSRQGPGAEGSRSGVLGGGTGPQNPVSLGCMRGHTCPNFCSCT